MVYIRLVKGKIIIIVIVDMFKINFNYLWIASN